MWGIWIIDIKEYMCRGGNAIKLEEKLCNCLYMRRNYGTARVVFSWVVDHMVKYELVIIIILIYVLGGILS